MLKRITQHTFLYAISPQIPKVVNLLLLPVLTKYLTTNDYAIYGIVLAYTGGLAALKELGLTISIVNVFTNHPLRWKFVWARLWGFLCYWSVAYSLLQAIILYFIIPDELGANKMFIIGGFTITGLIFDIPLIFGIRFHQLKERSVYIAIVTMIAGIVGVGINYYSIVVLRLGYLGWFISIFISSAFSCLFYIVPLIITYKVKPVFTFNFKFLKRYLKVALPTIPHNYSSYLYNASDRIILERMKVDFGEIGRYNFAYVFGTYVEMLSSALGMAIGPLHLRLFAQKSQQSHEAVRNLTFFLQVTFLIGAFVVCIWLKEIFAVLVSNPELESCYPYAVFIIMGYCYAPMYFSSVNLLFYYEHTSQLWKISFIGGVINVLLNIIFIPLIGVYASIGATFVSLLYIGYAGYFLKIYRTLSKVSYYPFLWIALTLVLSCLAFVLVELNWPVKVVITFSALVLYLLYLRQNFKTLSNLEEKK